MSLVTSTYQTEIDKIEREEWSEIITEFDDAVLYNTWEYGAIQWGEKDLSHLIIKKDNEVLAAAQARIVKLPFVGAGICYISWGPLWRRRGRVVDTQIFREAVRAIWQEYGCRRGLFVRILPSEIRDNAAEVHSILEAEGYKWEATAPRHHTILIDITPSLEELRRGLKKKWRENLNRGNRSELEVSDGNDLRMFAVFQNLYKEMHRRKGFAEFVSPEKFMAIQKVLPDKLKMRISIAYHNAEPVSGLVWSAIGERGIPIFSATANKGLKLRGSYILRWQMLEMLKKRGCRFFDQGGINPEGNPGSHHFKSGMGGKKVWHLGEFKACDSILSNALVKTGDHIQINGRRLKLLKKNSYISKKLKAIMDIKFEKNIH